jgi:DNA-directed RNA polymerase subunit RPC12/RpoP
MLRRHDPRQHELHCPHCDWLLARDTSTANYFDDDGAVEGELVTYNCGRCRQEVRLRRVDGLAEN